ncbi:hypothetical protein Z045_24960 [Rhodococcus pyridinivorans KG-16]|uniref:Uncharacterized protein n=1 Tax=Rhodococcus pyridinivorans KG-16 TaxID=1441730 RepID=A0A0V9UDE1_9NOCA|nr:hypothetical protein Z045_24960 [Rhodococcus pyridinivorans KG-16]
MYRDASVVDQDIDSAERLDSTVYDSSPVSFIGDVVLVQPESIALEFVGKCGADYIELVGTHIRGDYATTALS